MTYASLSRDITFRIRQRDRFRAEIEELLDRVLSNVAAAGHERKLAIERLAARLEHLGGEIDGAITRCFRPDERAAPVQALASQHTGELVAQPLVLAEQETDFAPAHTDVSSRHVRIRPDVTRELGHERLAETHHFGVGLALRIEIRAALATTHRQRR